MPLIPDPSFRGGARIGENSLRFEEGDIFGPETGRVEVYANVIQGKLIGLPELGSGKGEDLINKSAL